MVDAAMISILRTKHDALAPVMDERARRYWAACEARALGRGGVTAVARATGISRTTIRAGLGELQRAPQSDITLPDPQRLRRQGAGRKRLSQVDRQILDDLRALVESTTRGDPEDRKSTRLNSSHF